MSERGCFFRKMRLNRSQCEIWNYKIRNSRKCFLVWRVTFRDFIHNNFHAVDFFCDARRNVSKCCVETGGSIVSNFCNLIREKRYHGGACHECSRDDNCQRQRECERMRTKCSHSNAEFFWHRKGFCQCPRDVTDGGVVGAILFLSLARERARVISLTTRLRGQKI